MISGIGALDALQKSSTSETTSLFAGNAINPAPSDAGASFAAALTEAAGRTVDTLKQAESVSLKALSGETDTRAVVDAVMSAEQAMNTAVAIRDKIVTAYLEVSRMAI
ncbi:flagellar hook-basal body complex protein FliE [Mesorhizobium sp. SB112]|uniref:flagellar hook-basal body complex protein FliE n=1 Tax=Mesorhizobium sp. SB112 TaxID=3151853 RepID=UPI003266CBF8